jgi:hypothetical protein
MRNRWYAAALFAASAVLAGGAPPALAQIAAPLLIPATFSGENPAVIKWGAPSRVGFGGVGQRTTTDPATERIDFGGGFAGLRLVGETLAFGVEAVSLNDRESSIKDTREFVSAALAAQNGNVLAWGIGYQAFKQEQDGGTGLQNFAMESKEQVFGVSLRLADVWYIGGAVGRESVSQQFHDPFLAIDSRFYGERDTARAGLGFRRPGTVLVHAEVFGISRSDFDTRPGGNKIGGEDTSGGTLEFIFGNILLGGETRRTKQNDSGDIFTRTSGDIGWAPRQGFTLTLHYELRKMEVKTPMPGEPESVTDEMGAVVFAWLF